MEIFPTLASLGYGSVGGGELHVGRDQPAQLKALVAIHSTRLGPAVGGCRIRAYPNEAEAVEDVTRLARAMTYKAALARLRHGGGKAVILAPPGLGTGSFGAAARIELLRAFGRFVDGLGGRYVTTEDSGTSTADMDVVCGATRHVLGASSERGGSGDPSSFTAIGVRRGIEAIAHAVLGRADLKGLRVALQGVGNVGTHLARELAAGGADLIISDVDPARREQVATELGARSVEPEAILDIECDVVSPNALGGALTEAVVARLKAKVVAGAANNQLATPAVGQALYARGIFYAPDYAINAGGLINVAEEFSGYDRQRALDKTLRIYDTMLSIIERSRREKLAPVLVSKG